ncbi:MAG: trypsin-like peptidase domain-containing protein [Phycisphaerae bacterium]|nr:trypsin-like peptidase domain-containing protein [Phycisphaerae bacterium]
MPRTLLVVCLLFTGLGTSASADEAADARTGREILAKYQDAVIWISAVLKVDFGGRSRERKMEVYGTIIDPNGLTVVSYSMLDPISLLSSSMLGKDKDMPKAQFSDVKMELPDGTEVPVSVVLKDPDLDLAFLVPEVKEGEKLPKLTHIKLDTDAKAQVLDRLIILTRLGKAFDRQPCIDFTRLSAIVKKPRTFYVDSPYVMGSGVGTPVFTTEGKVLGISVMRKGPKSGGVSGGGAGDFSTVILPSEDVLEIAQQAMKKGKATATSKGAKEASPM